jgi:hypothetical protein
MATTELYATMYGTTCSATGNDDFGWLMRFTWDGK